MQRLPFLFFFILIQLASYGQLSDSDSEFLRQEMAKHVNELRISKGLKPLLFSDTLKAAAQNQSDYMAGINEITHDQKKGSTATPKKRVLKYKGDDFEIVGENVLNSIEYEYPLKKKELEEAALKMFIQWKNSPGHYANMIHPEYDYGDFAFSVGTKKKAIFATQVFGKRGVKIEGQATSNAYNIGKQIPNCKDEFSSYFNIVANMGNSIKIEGQEVVLYHHNFNYFHKIFPGPKDGLAVDLINKGQFDCGEPNKLDASEIYDGILLKPIFKDELLSGNKAQSDHRLITPIGRIPDEVTGQSFVASIIIIRDGQKCEYLVPSFIPSKKYDLRPIEPVLLNPEGAILKTTGVIKSQEVSYDFERGRTASVKNPKIDRYSLDVHSIRIVSYSSVEGPTENNEKLHTNRGESIKRHILKTITADTSKLSIVAAENWNEMYFQFKYLFADSLMLLSKDSIKSIIASKDETLPWDSLLFSQRKSIATINYLGELSDTASAFDIGELNLRTALAIEDYDLANKALFELYQSPWENPALFFDGFVFEALRNKPEIVQNSAALLSKIYSYDLHKTAQFISDWIPRSSEISNAALNNILHLYTLMGIELLRIWDLPSERLSNVIHPNRVNGFMNSNILPELVLNLHLTFIQYYGQINDGPGISKSFDYITEYFKENSLSEEDEVDLCLFFNSWSRYDLTNNFLLPRFKKNKINEDGVFVLAQTMNFYADTDDNEVFRKIHIKAAKLNKERWCRWINRDFQILRDAKIKQLYCDTCN